ncbi:aspartate carbamoyltransferase regulatory subunit [Shewanella sp. D64]|uniref:aspartate carbamoyltransferase regulatory subunit n=1 Tax=unclassified Shewanella TaxID=196818 RepID=UPI0022BA62AD|nr:MULTISPECIES: aspartate carbamoyltransferase regulatory subunit [unclassified Shewanella]MEC4728115.1 aspartate carbamoyltransferase regulatory subunit [Shewanella sp. D64]MEC4740235.1 aspartate carbamoyltransferase regulatory subunit [Shewanella sp. E94]WBJ94446.1 aspartate carbamoyltransferase regulatory subunit [Shewanella sp. MTB7]
MKRHLKVEAIEHGTVIDHISSGQGIKILKFFELCKGKQRITIGLNLPTSTGKDKDLIKIENIVFDQNQANQLSLFAPKATINVIENFEVVKKFKLALPEQILGVLICPNSNCICHDEPVESRFNIKQEAVAVKLKCHYCEKSFTATSFQDLR